MPEAKNQPFKVVYHNSEFQGHNGMAEVVKKEVDILTIAAFKNDRGTIVSHLDSARLAIENLKGNVNSIADETDLSFSERIQLQYEHIVEPAMAVEKAAALTSQYFTVSEFLFDIIPKPSED